MSDDDPEWLRTEKAGGSPRWMLVVLIGTGLTCLLLGLWVLMMHGGSGGR